MYRDFRLALRSLLRSPGFLTAAVLSLALAMGSSVAAFTVIDAIRLRALPFPDADRLVVLGEVSASGAGDRRECGGACDVAYATYAQGLRRYPFRSLDAVAAFTSGAKSLNTRGDPVLVTGGVVSPNVFGLLDVRPFRGRALTDEDDRLGVPLTTVLGYNLWATQFGSDPDIVGKDVKLSDSHYTVVGVMPPGFRFEVASDFWLPTVPTLDPSTRPSIRSVNVIGRLAAGRTLTQLRGELATIELPRSPGERGPEPTRLVADPLRARYASSTRSHDLVFGAVVTCVLLIACANLANLVLVRTVLQRREHAIRAALGADARRLARGVLLQNGIVVTVATILGVMLATSSIGVLRALPTLSSLRPLGMDYEINGRALLFAVAIAAVAAVLVSIVPARLAARGDVHHLLRGVDRTGGAGLGTWVRQLFVVAQVACATVLLTGALLMARTVMHYSRVDLGFASARLLSATPSYPHTWRVPGVYMPVTERIVDELRRLPGVEAVALRAAVPLAGRDGGSSITVAGRAEPIPRSLVTSQVQAVSPGYFAAVGVPLLTGRGFAAQDDEHGAPVAIVNRWAASHWWPNESAIGQIIRLGGSDGAASPLTIIGVVADNKASRPNLLLAEDGPELYRPYRQTPSPFPSFLVRSSSQPLTLLRPVRSVLTRLVPDRPLFAAPVSETAGRQLGGVRTNALQIAGFALVGLLLAVIGVYSVLAFETSRRTREIGIRGALGATGGRIARMVLGEASRLAVLGVLAGLPAAAVSTSLIRSLLYSTDPRDPLVYAAVVVTVLVVSLLAAYVPARRAARVSPIIAIRAD